MSTQIAELEKLLDQLLAEHRTLLLAVEQHQAAMRTLSFNALADATSAVEGSRTRLMVTEVRRRALVAQIVRLFKLPSTVSLGEMAAAFPEHQARLLALRNDLTRVAAEIVARTSVSQKVAGALLGHMNTVVRLIAGAIHSASVYTKQGMPTVAGRVGLMEAVG